MIAPTMTIADATTIAADVVAVATGSIRSRRTPRRRQCLRRNPNRSNPLRRLKATAGKMAAEVAMKTAVADTEAGVATTTRVFKGWWD